MKIDALLNALGKKTDKAARKGQAAPGFEALLSSESVRPGATRAGAPAEEKKSRPVTGTEEALLVSRTLSPLARPAPLFDTKPPALKDGKALSVNAAASTRAAVTVEHLATRAKAAHEPARVTAPQEKKPARGEGPRELLREPGASEGKKTDEAPANPLVQSTPVLSAPAEPFTLQAPAAVHDAAPLAPVAPLILDDPSARVVLLPTVARMSLDAGDAGRLNLQLKVKDGVTELSATGTAAPILEARQGELRVALAKEGLALGHFDLTQGQQHHHAERPDAETPVAPPTARRAASPSSNDPATEAGRVHVKV